jgi:hypothetical protein
MCGQCPFVPMMLGCAWIVADRGTFSGNLKVTLAV